ncbi:MAG: molybdenum cofactor guanylyltransferase [Pseudomonadota bacterium]
MSISEPLLVILAGGQSARMQGIDKAVVTLNGRRMIDILIDRFKPVAGSIVLSGDADRQTGLPTIKDDPSAPHGPAGALCSIAQWIGGLDMPVETFFTVPVDTPFLPGDLLERLSFYGATAIACDDNGLHPTIGYWDLATLQDAFARCEGRRNLPLYQIAALCQVRHVPFNPALLLNLNTMEDVRQAEDR